jgi:hypothetical protein
VKDLWVSTVKDYTRENMNYSSKFNDPLMQRGRIHKGVSFKGDEKSFLKDYSFDAKRYTSRSNNRTPINEMKESDASFSSTRPKKNGIIDLIGKNLKKPISALDSRNDDFF